MVYLVIAKKKENLFDVGFKLFNYCGMKTLEGKEVPGQFSVVKQRISE